MYRRRHVAAYTPTHGDGKTEDRASADVSRLDGSPDVAGPSVLSLWGGRVSSRAGTSDCCWWGTSKASTRSAASRGGRPTRWRCVASLGAGPRGDGPGPLDDFAHSAADRRGDASGGLYVDTGVARCRGVAHREDRRRRCHDAGSERRDAEHRAPRHGESYQQFLTSLAKASGIKTPTREALARLIRRRKKRTSNQDWESPSPSGRKVTKMKDGRTHLAHNAEHAVDLQSAAIIAVRCKVRMWAIR